MIEILKALIVGIITGMIFSILKLPVPVPPALPGLLGIIGIFIGFSLISYIIK